MAIVNLELSKAQGLTEAHFVVGKDQDRVSGALASITNKFGLTRRCLY